MEDSFHITNVRKGDRSKSGFYRVCSNTHLKKSVIELDMSLKGI